MQFLFEHYTNHPTFFSEIDHMVREILHSSFHMQLSHYNVQEPKAYQVKAAHLGVSLMTKNGTCV